MVGATVSYASRPATPDEDAALQLDLEFGPCSHSATVSTIDPLWALVDAMPDYCSGPFDDDSGLAHFDGQKWRYAGALPIAGPCDPTADLPPRVGADLGICGDGPYDAFLICLSGDGVGMAAYDRPRFCNTVQPTQALAEAIALYGLQWRHWGRSSATAVGRTRVKIYDPWVRVRVRAYRRVWRACTGGWAYTRLRTTTSRGRHVWQMLACPPSADGS